MTAKTGQVREAPPRRACLLGQGQPVNGQLRPDGVRGSARMEFAEKNNSLFA